MPNEFDLLQFFNQQTSPVTLKEMFIYFSHDSFLLTPLYELVKSGFVEEQGIGENKEYMITGKGIEEQATRENYRT